jgi:hypothetical protein
MSLQLLRMRHSRERSTWRNSLSHLLPYHLLPWNNLGTSLKIIWSNYKGVLDCVSSKYFTKCVAAVRVHEGKMPVPASRYGIALGSDAGYRNSSYVPAITGTWN